MKRFLSISLGFIFVALLLTVAVWWWVQMQIREAAQVPTIEVTEEFDIIDEQPEPEAIPLREVPLSNTQRKAAETVGIDVETFEITPAMINCAVASLGQERVDEIVAGDAPTALESFRLIGCTKAE